MPSGKLIRSLLADKETEFYHHKLALLFAADRLEHLEKEINPALLEGKSVITDRYLFSSIAYQSLNLSSLWVSEINKFAKMPEIIVFIDVSVETALKRINQRNEAKEIFEKKESLYKIKANYDYLLDNIDKNIKVIRLNGELSQDQIFDDITCKFNSFFV